MLHTCDSCCKVWNCDLAIEDCTNHYKDEEITCKTCKSLIENLGE